MSTRFVDRYAVILFDMNSTFMFGEDRFGEDEDFFSSYTLLGGSRLDRHAVDTAIRRCYRGMSIDYEDSAKADDFPTLAEGLRHYADAMEADIPLLEAVFAFHERGHVPPDIAACLRRLSRTHRLGIVSNIWARKDPWLAEFDRAGIADIWDVIVFSSDSRSIKPSPRLFREAMDAFDVPVSDMLFVGDSLRVDIAPARSLDLGTVWITRSAEHHPLADRIAASILDLEHMGAHSTRARQD
jgi:HAD superfamily hydrolase (TIGR01509 family)